MEIKLLSVIVPIYKKENTVKKELNNIYSVLSKTPYIFELVAVIDGTSLDKSLEKAKSLKLSNLKVYGYKTNKGKGQAVRFGMQKSKGDVVMFIDSGGDINPEGIVMMLEHMKWYGADVIIGSKLHSASRVNPYPLKRKILTYGYYMGVKFLFGLKTRDTQTGLKAYKRKVLEKVLDRLVIKRFAFDVEILAVADHLGFKKIFDCPVEVNWDKSNSSISGIFSKNGIWPFVLDTLAIFYRLKILRFYDDGIKRDWIYDKELKLKILTGGVGESFYKRFFARLFAPH